MPWPIWDWEAYFKGMGTPAFQMLNVASPDFLKQLAAITDATSSFDKAAEVERNNFETTRRLADACAEAGVPPARRHLDTQQRLDVSHTLVEVGCGKD